jgi:hypothetical protein
MRLTPLSGTHLVVAPANGAAGSQAFQYVIYALVNAASVDAKGSAAPRAGFLKLVRHIEVSAAVGLIMFMKCRQ